MNNALLPLKIRVADSLSYLAIISLTSAAEICSRSSSAAAAAAACCCSSSVLKRPSCFASFHKKTPFFHIFFMKKRLV